MAQVPAAARGVVLAAFGVLLGGWLFACATRAQPASTPEAGSAVQPANLLNLVEVTLEADSIQIPSSVTAGQRTFLFNNATDGERTAAIEGEGHRWALDRTIPARKSMTLEASLTPGNYVVVSEGGGRRVTASFRVVEP